jgi:hemoglobin-like flavoprotein
MTPEQITLVQSSWQKVLPIRDTAAALFYARLFETTPEVKSLFRGDMREQGVKLMQMIDVAVRGLSRLDEIVPAVQNLGLRHRDYGVKPEHYDAVAAALLWTLGQGLGAAFTAPVRDAWVAAYTVLATTMKDAAAAG